MAHPGQVRDREAVHAFLERDRPWSAWALCSLGVNDWPHVRFWLGETDGTALWAYDHPRWGGSLQTFGSGPALEALVRAVPLPPRAFARLTSATRPSVETRYRLDRLEPIVRMWVTPAALRPTPDAPPAEPVGLESSAELARLYAGWPASHFSIRRLHEGYRYRGIRHRGVLVAVAENVLRSTEHGLAIVQGVYVEPRWRGRGLARAVTAALTTHLFEEGARDVVLDVRAENQAALAAYTRLGFHRWGTYLGGPAVAK
ncbi:MAG: GNAT family N-acetyltransferase [Chloroflexi bacterium]|nr:GNAT family N-acetyltransferase [Chloroflexota bacterium]